MRWLWPWPNDLETQTWPRYGQDVTPYQKWSFYVNSFKSYSPNRQTDRQTHTHKHDENITSTAYAGGNNYKTKQNSSKENYPVWEFTIYVKWKKCHTYCPILIIMILWNYDLTLGSGHILKYTVNQRLLVSANTEFLCDVFFHVCKHPSPCDITTWWCYININCNSIPFTVHKLSISENRPCSPHRCPADTN